MRRPMLDAIVFFLLAVSALAQTQRPAPPSPPSPVYAIRAGRLIDPAIGSAAPNQIIAVQDGKIFKQNGVTTPVKFYR